MFDIQCVQFLRTYRPVLKEPDLNLGTSAKSVFEICDIVRNLLWNLTVMISQADKKITYVQQKLFETAM